jgi:CHASE3 domain sensor protein
MKQVISLVFLTVALAGCAVDVVSSEATEAALNAQEAKQAQQLTDQVRSQLNAAMRTEQDRLQQAEKVSNP